MVPVAMLYAQTANNGTTPKTGEFYDKELDLHFNYPLEMQTLDGSAQMESGHRNIYGVSGDDDPEHQKARRCDRILLDAELPRDKAPQRAANLDGVWVDDTKEYRDSRKPEPIFAQIVMMEFVRDCVPQNVQENVDDVLGSMAMSVLSEPWINRMPKPLWYEVGKQKIHMNSGAGRPVINGQLAPAPIVIMSMATEWRGHLLMWMFTANDTEIFNKITKSQVQFGNGPWGTMFEQFYPQGTAAPRSNPAPPQKAAPGTAFISSLKYTNAFFGFSLALPKKRL